MKNISDYLHNLKGFSGAVAIKQGSQLLFKECYGYANYEFDVPNNNDTRFCIASITKPFTALALMKLQEMGKLTVHDSISKFIPDFPKGDVITLHHILTHTSGIRNYRSTDAIFSRYYTLKEMVDVFTQWELDFEPGSMYRYGNTGYLLLAYVIEQASGMTFDQFIAEHIFTLANMTCSGSVADGSIIKHKAHGYFRQHDKLFNAPIAVAPLTLLGCGNLYASIDDMIRYMDALFDGKIVSPGSMQKLIDKHIPMESSIIRFYGYGWFVDKLNGKTYIECTGGLRGFLSRIIRFIEEDITIIILTNVEDQELFFEVTEALPKLILEAITEKTNYHILSYEQYAQKKHAEPYAFSLSKSAHHLYYFGANHSCNPTNEQYPALEKHWNDFLQVTQGKNCVVIIEGSRRRLCKTKDEAITQAAGEGGFMTYVAHKEGIPVICPEPQDETLQQKLLTYFTQDAIIYREFAQAVQQFHRYKKNDASLEFESFYQRYTLPSLDVMKNIHATLFKSDLDIDDESFFYNITNPVVTDTIINKVCRQASMLRDQYIVASIDQLIQEGKNIFVVYGSTHAVMQELAIKDIWNVQ